jgi:hypothetical protein
MKMKIRASIKRKMELDRTPCELREITLHRVREINPSSKYRLQKWEWLKELLSGTVVPSDNAFTYTAHIDRGCCQKVDRAVAAMTRDSGGLYEARAVFVSHVTAEEDLIEIQVRPANDEDKKAWEDNVTSQRRSKKRFKDRRPDLIAVGRARLKVRKRVMLGE